MHKVRIQLGDKLSHSIVTGLMVRLSFIPLVKGLFSIVFRMDKIQVERRKGVNLFLLVARINELSV